MLITRLIKYKNVLRGEGWARLAIWSFSRLFLMSFLVMFEGSFELCCQATAYMRLMLEELKVLNCHEELVDV